MAFELCPAVAEDRLFSQQEIICAVDALTDILYRETLVWMFVLRLTAPARDFLQMR